MSFIRPPISPIVKTPSRSPLVSSQRPQEQQRQPNNYVDNSLSGKNQSIDNRETSRIKRSTRQGQEYRPFLNSRFNNENTARIDTTQTVQHAADNYTNESLISFFERGSPINGNAANRRLHFGDGSGYVDIQAYPSMIEPAGVFTNGYEWQSFSAKFYSSDSGSEPFESHDFYAYTYAEPHMHRDYLPMASDIEYANSSAKSGEPLNIPV